MNFRKLQLVVAISLFLACQGNAQTVWQGTVSGDWNNPANWSNNVPNLANDATIPASPPGMFFPSITYFLFFDFNVQNYGVLKVEGAGAVTIFGTFINHAGATLIIDESSTNFLIETMGSLENHGVIFNNGDFNNEGIFTNSASGAFANSVVFTNSGTASFSNLGVFDNFGELLTEADFHNSGTINNHNFLNNNALVTNSGSLITFFGATLRNDHELLNQAGGELNIQGILLNNHLLQNLGYFPIAPGAGVENGFSTINGPAGSINNQGTVTNVLCAIFENKGAFQNTGIFQNEGVAYLDATIAPNPTENIGNGISISPGNTGSLCQNALVYLAPATNTATVAALDVANAQFQFCAGWQLLVNNQPSVSFNGCASIGPHPVNLMFVDPFGRTTLCPATVTVLENQPPLVNCPSNISINLGPGQCASAVNLVPPVVVFENCGMQGIVNNAPPIFPTGQTVVAWTATDLSGNTANCSQTVTLVDTEFPVVSCPPNKTLNCQPGVCGVSNLSPDIAGDPATATDNCGTPTLTNNAPAILAPGTSTITWKAVDLYGNASFCTQTIAVTDNQAPSFLNCPSSIISVQAGLPGCQAQVNWNPVSASDNCGIASLTTSIAPGSVFSLGQTIVAVDATDLHDNTANCTFTVEVVDNQGPIFSNCPADINIVLPDCGDMAMADWAVPMATDFCGVSLSSNFQPGAIFPNGSHLVTYTATDGNGNVSTCSFLVNILANMALDCPSGIEASVPAGQTMSVATWNTPPGNTQCPACKEINLPGFQYMGALGGKRYYLYLGGEITWAAANALAIDRGGYLATIGSTGENGFLHNEFLPQLHQAWIGLSDQAQEGSFSWANGETPSFSNWQAGNAPNNDLLDYAVFLADGTWADDSLQATHTFLLELPCYETSVSSSDPAALASFAFPIGTTSVAYEATDGCGNTCLCSFEVNVLQGQAVTPCASGGNPQFGWIERIENPGFSLASGNNGGSADFTNTVHKVPSPGCFTALIPGGVDTSAHVFWRVWADLNSDGDFFDPNETLASIEGTGILQACYDVPLLPTGPIRVRIALSRWEEPEPCGNYPAGEVEDFLLDFVDSTGFVPSGTCSWVFDTVSAAIEQYKVVVDWSGFGGANCEAVYFEVERSADTSQFERISLVQAIQPGNLPISYQFKDATPFYGANYYRLRAVLEDSTESLSPVMELDYQVDFETIFFYPNPASKEVILHTYPFAQRPAFFFISDMKGQVISRQSFDSLSNEPLVIDVSNFVAGVYSLYLKVEGKRGQVRHFVVVGK